MQLSLLFLLSSLSIGLTSALHIWEWTDRDADKLSDPTAERLILFYADWCGACNVFKPSFELFAKEASTEESVKAFIPRNLEIVKINYQKSPEMSARFRVTHLPSLFHMKDGKFWNISGDRGQLVAYFRTKGHNLIKPIPSLFDPSSRAASTLGKVGSIGFAVMTLAEQLGLSPIQVVLAGFFILVLALVITTSLMVYFAEWSVYNTKNTAKKEKESDAEDTETETESEDEGKDEDESGSEQSQSEDEVIKPARKQVLKPGN